MKKFIQLIISTFLFLVLYSLWMATIAQEYRLAEQHVGQYNLDQSSGAVYEKPLVVDNKDTEPHRGRDSDYYLELRDTEGKLHHVGVSQQFWRETAQGGTVTGEIWRDKVCRVKNQGQFQRTAANPISQTQEFRMALLEWGGVGIFVTVILLYSNWYYYKNRYNSEAGV